MKLLAQIFAFFVINFILAPLSHFLGVELSTQLIVVGVLGTLMSFIPQNGFAFFALIPSLWTKELLKNFRHEGEFLSRIPKRNQYVKSDTIHMVDLGADPAVLVDNTTYPIASAQRPDSDVVISLHKFDTENTIVTDDELNNLPYDKPGTVLESHRLSLEESTMGMSAHSLAPQAALGTTPVVFTSGVSNQDTNARKRMTTADLVKMKRYLDDLKIPKKGRELVLCPAHTEDLLLVSQVFRDQFFKTNSGTILDLFGFKISQFSDNPLFSNATGEKKAWGAAANAADELDVSLAYFNGRAVQATGSAKIYHAKAENDPERRESKFGMRLYHLCLPKKTTGFGAIVSNIV